MGNENAYNDTQLLRQLAEGSENAFASVYRMHHPAVFRAAFQLLKTREAAEDVCTEVFANLWQNRHSLGNIQSLSAYLFIAARNRSLTVLKNAARSQTLLDEVKRSFPARSLATEEHLLHKEYVAFIKQQIEQLPPRSKEVFTLCREEGFSYNQVSSQLGISRDAVKSHMVYSMKKLKAFVEKDLGISFSLLVLLASLV